MPIERVSANDATTLATDRGPAPMNIGVLLMVEGGATMPFDEVRTLLTGRIPQVRRLRQRLQTTPPGCGRAIWVDAADFEINLHLEQITLGSQTARQGAAPGGDEGAATTELLSTAAAFVCAPLPRDRPLWAARWITGLDGDEAALVLSAHHCLADGLGGLAVLSALCDEASPAPPSTTAADPTAAADASSATAADATRFAAASSSPFPTPAPRSSDLAIDAWRARLQGVRQLPTRVTDGAAGLRELVGARHRPRLAERTSLNRPTGPHRRLTRVVAPVAGLVDAAHTRGCTVNDLVLCAVAGALGAVLRARGEQVAEIVASVPVSGRRSASADRLGNHTGVMSLTVPLLADPDERLRRITTMTADRKGPVRGASSGPLGLAFRALAKVGAFQVFIDHQRLVHTFVTNVKGPTVPWHFGGHRVTAVTPMAITPGNVGVSFDILSYAGQLVVTLVADPVIVPDQAALTADLASELAHFSGPGRARSPEADARPART